MSGTDRQTLGVSISTRTYDEVSCLELQCRTTLTLGAHPVTNPGTRWIGVENWSDHKLEPSCHLLCGDTAWQEDPWGCWSPRCPFKGKSWHCLSLAFAVRLCLWSEKLEKNSGQWCFWTQLMIRVSWQPHREESSVSWSHSTTHSIRVNSFCLFLLQFRQQVTLHFEMWVFHSEHCTQMIWTAAYSRYRSSYASGLIWTLISCDGYLEFPTCFTMTSTTSRTRQKTKLEL